jgi:hypothetical protein
MVTLNELQEGRKRLRHVPSTSTSVASTDTIASTTNNNVPVSANSVETTTTETSDPVLDNNAVIVSDLGGGAPSETSYQSRRESQKTLRKSTFAITINTQQRFNRNDIKMKEFVDEFETVLNNFITEMQTTGRFIKIKTPGHTHRKQIRRILPEFNIEHGEISGTIHAHGYLQIQHRSNVQLEYSSIKSYFQTELNLKNGIHFHCTLLASTPDSYKRWLDYIRKNQERVKRKRDYLLDQDREEKKLGPRIQYPGDSDSDIGDTGLSSVQKKLSE